MFYNIPMQDNEFYTYLTNEYNQPFSGWDFSYLAGRMEDIPPRPTDDSWDYAALVIAAFGTSEALLDMGTGGGEYLSSLQPLPAQTCATEGYPLNVPIARQRLEPLGVKVHDISEDFHSLPFADAQFDLIINRHEYYPPQELSRILKPGGTFITQQVGGGQDAELNTMLAADPCPYAHWTLQFALQELERETPELRIIDRKENFPLVRFYDVGAVVYYLKAVPWQIPNFSIEQYFEKLVAVRELIQAKGHFDVHAHRFLIVAQKEG